MKVEEAVYNFDNGCNCSQAILAAYCEDFGLDFEKAALISVVFGGGVGRQGKMCGCVSGALMVLGLKFGVDSTKDIKVRTDSYDIAKQFCERFIEINGALDCKDIIKYNLANLEDRQKAQENNIFKTRCAKIVANTTKLLEEFVAD